jgi:hypothetical protein
MDDVLELVLGIVAPVAMVTIPFATLLWALTGQ